MEYLNLHVSVLDSGEYKSSSCAQKLAWLRLLRYCAGQENGGEIANAFKWNDAQWRDIVGISYAIARRDCPLYGWKDKVLLVEFYPVEQERARLAKRLAAYATNAKRWDKRVAPSGASESLSDTLSESLPPSGMEGKGREGNEREGKGTEATEHTHPEFASIPTEAEVRAWASGAPGIDPDYAASRAAALTENNLWLNAHNKLINWRGKIVRYWAEDRDKWLAEKKGAAASPQRQALPSDDPLWWSMAWPEFDGLVNGALMAKLPTSDRLREIWNIRRLWGNLK